MRYDIWFIAVALVMLLAGQVLGEWMAQTGDHSLALVHSHMTVAGWVTMAAFGLIHHAYPELRTSSLAFVQFLLASLGTLLFVLGLWVLWMTGERLGAVAGSYTVIAAAVLFIAMFFRSVVFSAR